MPFDINAARQSGYTDSEIQNFLAQNHPEFDVPSAVKSGYSLDEIAKELNTPSNAPTEDPGLLKSAAAGVMSGIPLAETATAGIESLIHGTPYAKEHQELEQLKDQAWDKHPWAYGAGKTAGIVGTGAVLPASIPAAIGVGAAAGVDETENLKALPGNVMKGGAMGAALGTIGEKVISPAIGALPKLGKQAVASIMPGKNSIDSVNAFLKDPAAIESALNRSAASEKMAEGLNSLQGTADELSAGARNMLRSDVSPITSDLPKTPGNTSTFTRGTAESTPSPVDALGIPLDKSPGAPQLINPAGSTVVTSGGSGVNLASPGMSTMDTLAPIFNEAKGRLTIGGVASTADKEAAVRAIDAQYNRLVQIAAQNGGKIPENVLGQVIRDIQEGLSDRVFDTTEASAAKDALKNLSGALNSVLKTSNLEYGKAMVPVANLRDHISDVKKTFRLDETNAEGFSPSDATNQKLGNILNENKTNAQEVLNKFGDLTGFDFLKNAKDFELAQGFNSGERGGHGLQAWGAGIGATIGRIIGIPGGALAGGAAGGLMANALDGGQIAKGILTKWMSIDKSMVDSGVKAALQKYGPILANAAKQGGNQLAATHYVLATSHPEYQQLIDTISKEPNQ